MAKRKELTIPAHAFLERIAWLEHHDRHAEAEVLRELSNRFIPPYRINEADVRPIIEEFRRWDAAPRIDD